MRRILIASSKGGCGKTTLATNLAVAMARRGRKVWLIDADAQGSSAEWAHARGTTAPSIGIMHSADNGQISTAGWSLRIPPSTEVLVVDTPAGLRPHQLSEFLRRCDTLLVPIVPSGIDTRASSAFLSELANAASVRAGGVRVALVANRVKTRTIAARELPAFADGLPFPLIASLRDTQAYVLAGAMGRGVFDYTGPSIAACHDDWTSLLEWLMPAAQAQPQAAQTRPQVPVQAAPLPSLDPAVTVAHVAPAAPAVANDASVATEPAVVATAPLPVA
jgi:chromosome partitioning protein